MLMKSSLSAYVGSFLKESLPLHLFPVLDYSPQELQLGWGIFDNWLGSQDSLRQPLSIFCESVSTTIFFRV